MTATAPRSPWGPADELRKARKQKGMEQLELADLVGVSEKTISRWENGHGEPSITQWRTIARVTGAAWLLRGDDGIVTKGDAPYNGLIVVDDSQLRLPIDLPQSRSEPELSLV